MNPLPINTNNVGGRNEYGRYGWHTSLSGGVGPFGFDPMFMAKGGWKGWADGIIATLRQYQIKRLNVWCADGNTDRQGWIELEQRDPSNPGEMFDKSVTQRGDKIGFDAALYRDPRSLDAFEREVANAEAKAYAFARIRREVEVLWVYLGNVFDRGIGGARALKEWGPKARAERIARVLSPYIACEVDGVAVDASSGASPTSVEAEISAYLLANSKCGFGIEIFPVAQQPHWSTNPRVHGWANAQYVYKLASRDGYFVNAESVRGTINAMLVSKPAPGTFWKGEGEVSKVSKQEAIEYIRFAQALGVNTYASVLLTPQERKQYGIQ